MERQRVLSGIQPSGDFHIGNYLGAIRHWVTFQNTKDAFYCVVDLHALTLDIEPSLLRQRTIDAAINLLASGLDPERCTLFIQSQVPEHPRLSWLLECTATIGELNRMTQFKEKGASTGQSRVHASLYTYPVLMAADILLYNANQVPVGDDQRQHLELARDIATKFNSRFGETFIVPQAATSSTTARVMDLQHPERKMSKSLDSPLGTIAMFDPPEEIERKIRKAVTDTDGEVRFDPSTKPGLSNLLNLLSATTDETPQALAEKYTRYGDLKRDLAEALIEMLRPVRERRSSLAHDLASLNDVLKIGADRAHEIAAVTYGRAAKAMGCLEYGVVSA